MSHAVSVDADEHALRADQQTTRAIERQSVNLTEDRADGWLATNQAMLGRTDTSDALDLVRSGTGHRQCENCREPPHFLRLLLLDRVADAEIQHRFPLPGLVSWARTRVSQRSLETHDESV